MGIYVDQVGYIADSKKIAIVTADGCYKVMRFNDTPNEDSLECVKEVKPVYFGLDDASGDDVWKLDFSDVTNTGRYVLVKDSDELNPEHSVSFTIASNPYSELIKALSKCFYYQRCGIALEEKYAGVYSHAACHIGKSIHLEDYMNKVENPVAYDLQGGWHDAGDFGRYSTAASVALGHLLYAYELFPESFDFNMNIPESGNGIPDILNECRYELDWLIKMQADDGGVYHKLTAYNHADFIMPEYDHDQFMLFPVSSMAVADYVAIMCVASRVYAKFDAAFADKALAAARKSYKWLENNGYIGFHNPQGSNTGEYDDECDADERLWAVAEMLRTDVNGDTDSYRDKLKEYVFSGMQLTDMGWTDVAGFSLLSVLTDSNKTAGTEIIDVLKKAMFDEADKLIKVASESGYNLCMKPEEYVWGSNMVVLNKGMLLILAGLSCEDVQMADKYYDCAKETFHYILGRNALDRSYVTGFGEKAYRNPHNRTSACDNIDDPMPGWVSGGPFKTPVDPDAKAVIPVGTPPMKCQADVVGSYSTNEITIYWNSPAVFITAFLDRR